MAIVKYGGVVTEIKGLFSGAVFQRCGQSLSLRCQPSVRVSQSPDSFMTRSNMTIISNGWAGVSESQKADWTYLANTYPTVDRYGNPIVLTGYQLFVHVNMPLVRAGAECVLAAYAYNPPANTIEAVAVMHVNLSDFAIAANGVVDSQQLLLLYLSDPLPANCVLSHPKIRYFRSFDENYNFADAFFEEYIAWAHQTPVIGKWYYQELWLVNTPDGQRKLVHSGFLPC